VKSCASSADLFTFLPGPPWAGIDGRPVLAKLDVESRLTGPHGDRGGSLRRTASHNGHGFASQYELADIYGNPIHTRKEHMIPAAGIQDQELPVGTEWTGINHPAVTRRCDLGARPGGHGDPPFGSTHPVGNAEIA